MQSLHQTRQFKFRLRGTLLAAASLFATAAHAGPPLLCHPFDTGGAASPPWGAGGWNTIYRSYDTARLSARYSTPAWRADAGDRTDGNPAPRRDLRQRRSAVSARDLAMKLDLRIAAATDPATQAQALFDTGYFAETLQDIVRLQGYDMPGIGKIDARAITTLLDGRRDGSARIAQALRLSPDDASMHFAAALAASADRRPSDYARRRSWRVRARPATGCWRAISTKIRD